MSAIGDLKEAGKAVSVASVFKELGAIKYVSASVLGLTAIISAIGFVQQKYKELDQNTQQAFSSWSNSNITFNSQIEEITKLKSALDEGTLSEQEAYNAKSQLFDIQQSLVDSYGNQASGIDLVNGKLEDQISLMNSLSRAEANRLINENINGYNRAVSKMEKERMLEIGSIPNFMKDSAEGRALQEVLDKYKDSIVSKRGSDGLEMFFAKGSAEEVYETINNFMNDVRDLSKKFDGYAGEGLFDRFLNTSEYSLSKAKDVLETYKMTYEEAKKANLIADKELYQTAVGAERIDGPNGTAIFKFKNQTALDWMNDARNAVEEYNDALLSGDTSRIEEAATSFETVKNQVDYLLENTGMSEHKSVFDDIFGQINSRLSAQKKLEKELTSGKLKKSGEILKASGITALDLKQAFDAEGLQDGEAQLIAIIDLADELGYISKESKDDVYGLIDTLANLGYVVGGSVSDAAKSFNALAASTKTAIDTQNNLTAALAAGNSATGMTYEQMKNVISAFEDIEGFDMANLFERTATGVKMNTNAFKAYNKALQLQTELELMTAIQQKQEEITQATIRGMDTSALETDLNHLQLLLSEYEGATSKYNAYVTASSSANSRDSYGNVVAGYKSVQELIKQGWVTDDSVTSYLDLLLGENWLKDFGTAGRAFDQLSEKIEGTNHSLKDYLTTDSRGVWNFAEDAVKLGFGSIGSDGLVSLDLTGEKLELIAQKLNTSTEMVELFGKALSEAGMDVSFDSAGTKLENINQRIEDLNAELEKMPDGADKIQKALELKGLENKKIKLAIDVALSKDGANTVTELLALDDEDLVKEVGVELGDVDEVRRQLEAIGRSTGEIPINVKLDETQFNSLLGMTNAEVKVTAVVEEAPEIPDGTMNVTVEEVTMPELPQATGTANYELGDSPDEVPDAEGIANFELGSHPEVAPSIWGTANYRGNFSNIGSAPTLYGTVVYSSVFFGGKTAIQAGTMTSIAHSDGTAYNVLNYKRLTPSHADGRVALPSDEYALTNEIGRESIVRDGIWYMLPPGPHMEHLKKGDIVFSAKQTEDLLRAGKTSTYARALSAGTLNALASGTIHAYSGYTGDGYNPWASSNAYKPPASSVTSTSASSSSSSDKEPEWTDWIEIAIARIKRAVDKLKDIASSAFKSLQTNLSATVDAVSMINKEMEVQTRSYHRYISQASSIGLPSDIAEAVQNGAIDIRQYDEDTQKKINQYKEWYDKALACADAIDELKNSLAELYKQKFDSIEKNFSNRLDQINYSANEIFSKIDTLEAKGYLDSISLYNSLAETERSKIEMLNEEYRSLTSALNDAMASGEIEKDSEAWYEMSNQILDVKEELDKANVSLIEYKNTIREIEWGYFDYAQERITELSKEADFLINLMSGKNLYTDNGQLSETGMATAGLHGMNYNTYMSQADRYAAEVKKLNAEIAKDPNNTKLIDRREELLGLQRDSINAAKQEQQAIVDMVEKGIDVQLDSMQELIDKYNDALDSAKDFNDYQKKVRNQTSDIADLNKQLAAYMNDDSEETRAAVQKLQVELQKAQEELDETEYDQFITDQKKILDDLYSEYETSMNQRLDNIDVLIEDMIDSINANSGAINDTLHEIAEKNGYTLSDNMNSVWSSSALTLNNTVATYGDDFKDRLTGISYVLDQILANTNAMAENSNSGKYLYNDIPAFASGGLARYTGLAYLDGTPARPEAVLNAQDTENFMVLREALRKINSGEHKINLNRDCSALSDLYSRSVSEITSQIREDVNSGAQKWQTVSGDTVFHIQIDHVQDYNDFVTQLQHDDTFEKMIQAMTIDRLTGKDRFEKYRVQIGRR